MFPAEILVHHSWTAFFDTQKDQLDRIRKSLDLELANNVRVLPAPGEIFQAFQSDLADIKVLILGQDPYPTPGDAMGLAFSVPVHHRIPASLKNIFKELHDDLGIEVPEQGNLSHWAQQGVLLLNTTLTVAQGQPLSHSRIGWSGFIDATIRHVATRPDRPLVALLWGAAAQRYQEALFPARVLKAAHPSPLSARSGFFGCRHFSLANEILTRSGIDPIDWSIPIDSHE